jgi:hypothetical protein
MWYRGGNSKPSPQSVLIQFVHLGSQCQPHENHGQEPYRHPETIEGWRDSIFQSPILNRIWQLLPGFILWKIWKERNRRIFKSASRNWQEVWTTIHSNIKETIFLHPWTDQDLNCPMNERLILNSWQLNFPPLPLQPLHFHKS